MYVVGWNEIQIKARHGKKKKNEEKNKPKKKPKKKTSFHIEFDAAFIGCIRRFQASKPVAQ